jgi:hypothetical protein
MGQQLQRDVKWDKKTVEEFSKRFAGLMTWAEDSGVPMPVMEGAVRDWLASLEALRQARMLAMQFQAMGAPGFVLPKTH